MNSWRDEVGPTHLCAVVRVGLGILLAIESRLSWVWLHERYFPAAFHWPMLPPSLVPSPAIYSALFLAQFALAISIFTGVLARPALFLASLIQLQLLLDDRLLYHNYRYTFALALFLTSLMPCDRALRLSSPPREGPLWAQRLLQLQLSLIYLASGGSKLLDGDWRGGRVIADGVKRSTAIALSHGAPAWTLALLQRAAVAGTLAKCAIATELFLALGLWPRTWRPRALWVGLIFHLTIQLTTTVGIFSWLMILLYALFAKPQLGERIVRFHPQRHRYRVRLIAALDWLRRFRFEPAERFAIVDRDGRVTVAAESLALLARATPLFFATWPLLALYAKLRPQKR